jgi:hypothetical protein
MSDLQAIVERLLERIAGARGLPLSASCVLNRLELLGTLEELRNALAAELLAAEAVTSRRELILRDAERDADRIVEAARLERLARASDTEVVREADLQARRLLAAAHDASSTARGEADSYVDGRLAELEVILARTLTSVTRGRAALAGEIEPFPGHDPAIAVTAAAPGDRGDRGDSAEFGPDGFDSDGFGPGDSTGFGADGGGFGAGDGPVRARAAVAPPDAVSVG